MRPLKAGEVIVIKGKLLVVFAVFTTASPPFVRAQDQPIEVQVVDAMNKVFGVHPGFRATHAKGLIVEGTFRGAPQGAVLSKPPCSMEVRSLSPSASPITEGFRPFRTGLSMRTRM